MAFQVSLSRRLRHITHSSNICYFMSFRNPLNVPTRNSPPLKHRKFASWEEWFTAPPQVGWMPAQEMECQFLYRVRSVLHSARKASIGLTDAALLAGIKLASNAETPSTPATAANVGTSHELTPNNSPRMTVAAITEQTSPMTMPIPISHAASLS